MLVGKIFLTLLEKKFVQGIKKKSDDQFDHLIINFSFVIGKMTEKRQTSQGYVIRILQHFATKLRCFCPGISRSKFHS